MTRQETIEMLSVLQIAYPQFYKGQTQQQANQTVDLWASMFADDDAALAREAVKKLIATRTETWPPNIGLVKAEMYKLSKPEAGRTDLEAWSLIRKAIGNGAYHALDEWNKLPGDIKGCVTPELLHGWAIDEEFNEGVIMSQFLRSYRARAERSREYDLMPASSRRLAEQSRAAIEQKEESHAAD